MKAWDKELNQIYSKYQDNNQYNKELREHTKQRRKNIEIGKQAVLKEQFELNKRQMYYISKKHETE